MTPFSETARVFESLLKEGKIRAIGVSNFTKEQMETFQKSAPLHVLQSPFNLFESGIEKTKLAYCLKHNIATFGYGSFCRGLLTGKIGKNTHFKGDDIRSFDPKFKQPHYLQYLACVSRLQEWAKKKYNRSLVALAIRWCLDKGISSALWGARKRAQIEGIEELFGWKLSALDLADIDHMIEETITASIGPDFMAPPTREAFIK